jgi:hypothetical protein
MVYISPIARSILLALVALAPSSSLFAEPRNARFLGGTWIGSAQSQSIRFALQTPYGREIFTFSPASQSTDEVTHYHGVSYRRGATRGRTRAALSIDSRVGHVFFTSRRTGRPMAATFAIAEDSIGNVHISKTTRFTTLPCGHSDHTSIDPIAAKGLGMYALRSAGGPTAPLSQTVTGAFSPPRILEVGLYADAQFTNLHGSSTNRYMQATMNAVDLLYMSELGIRVKTRTIRIAKARPRSGQGHQPEQVLEEFRRMQVDSSQSADLHHLFTGKLFTDTTIGLAYVATACTAGGDYAVGLSRSVKPALQPLVAAHELAHGLSAVHDSTPLSLMNPALSPTNTTIPETARADIHQFVSETGSCIKPDDTPSVTLSLSILDGTFTADIGAQTWSIGSCAVALQAQVATPSHKVRKGAKRFRWRTITSASVGASRPGERFSTRFSTSSPSYSDKKLKRFRFRSVLSCNQSRAISQIQSALPQQIGATTLTDAPAKDWLTTLIANFRNT